MNGRFWLTVLVVTILGFFGGWLVFGELMSGFYESHSSEAANNLAFEEPRVWAIAIGTLAWGLLITWVLQKTGSNDFQKGLINGLIIGFLVSVIFDFSLYAMWDMSDSTLVIVDIIVGTVFWGILGGVGGWVLGMQPKAAEATAS